MYVCVHKWVKGWPEKSNRNIYVQVFIIWEEGKKRNRKRVVPNWIFFMIFILLVLFSAFIFIRWKWMTPDHPDYNVNTKIIIIIIIWFFTVQPHPRQRIALAFSISSDMPASNQALVPSHISIACGGGNHYGNGYNCRMG